MERFYAGKYIFWYKGTLKTQYGLVHKFARYKQFHKHMIILKNVNNCDITYKTDFHFFFFFVKITLVLWEWKQWFPAASVKTFQMIRDPQSEFLTG